MLYTATVLLKRSEASFWRMTPRKLNALASVHIEVKSGKKKEEKVPEGLDPALIQEGPWKGAKFGYVDQI